MASVTLTGRLLYFWGLRKEEKEFIAPQTLSPKRAHCPVKGITVGDCHGWSDFKEPVRTPMTRKSSNTYQIQRV